jgi:hypothetical protein
LVVQLDSIPVRGTAFSACNNLSPRQLTDEALGAGRFRLKFRQNRYLETTDKVWEKSASTPLRS